MASNTPYFNFTIPSIGESGDVDVLNANTSSLDGILFSLAEMLAPKFNDSSSVTYSSGDLCTNGNPPHLYKCIGATSGGSWDSTKWEQTDIKSLLS